MSGYTPTITYRAEFEGDQVVFKLRRMKRKLFNKILPELDLSKVDESGKTVVSMTPAQSLALMEMIAGELKDYVVSMEGLVDAEGNVLSFDEVVEQAYFQELVMGLVSYLMEHSRPTEEEEKNSDAPQVTSLTDSVSVALSS